MLREFTYTYRITTDNRSGVMSGVMSDVSEPPMGGPDILGDEVAFYTDQQQIILLRITEFADKYKIPVYGCKEHCGTPNEHFHFFFDTDENKKKLSDNLNKRFPEWTAKKKDKKLKALKQYAYAPDSAFKYLSKGDKSDVPPCIVINTVGLTQEQILEYQRQYWATKETKKSKDSKKNSLVFKEWFIENKLESFRLPGTKTYSFHNPQKVASSVRDYYSSLDDWYMEINVQRCMHLIYNSICRIYDIDTYERYCIGIDKRVCAGFDWM